MTPTLTTHAIQRAQQRIPGVTTEDQARAILTSRAIVAAIAFGCRLVKLGTGNRVILRGATVVTVIPAERQSRNAMDRMSRGGRSDG